MVQKFEGATWQEDSKRVIRLVNRTENNYILELPSGRYRLDAGHTMQTMDSILNIVSIRSLVDEGLLVVEHP